MNDNEQTTAAEIEKIHHPKTIWNWMLRVIQGAIIGAGAILPGISGGVLCVIFGIYRPMMALLAHPFRTFKIYAKLLLPVLIGWILGFVGLAKGVEWLLSVNANITVWLFIGLIAGMMPSLFKEAGKKGRTRMAWIALVVSTIVIFAILYFLQHSTTINIQPNLFWYFVCGIFWGVSLVVPGMSSYSILTFLGLYEPMTAGIGNIDLSVIIPLLIGVALIILISARAINYLFKKHYPATFHMILGFVIASTLAIIPMYSNFADITETLLSMAALVAGFVIAWLMDKLGQKIKPKDEEPA